MNNPKARAVRAALLEAFGPQMKGSDVAVIAADRHGVIMYWSSGAEAMFGYGRQDALGSSLDLIIPERLRDRHWEGYRQVMSTGETRYRDRTLAVPAMRRDGKRISVEFAVALLRDHERELIGVGAVMHDVTAQWESQAAQGVAAVRTGVARKRRPPVA